MPQVILETYNTTIDVETGQTLLDAALASGVDYPHSCRSGNCSACKSKLMSGEVDLMPYSEFALSDEERAEGYILACRCMVWEDSCVTTIGLDDEADVGTEYEAQVVSVEDATHDIKQLRVKAVKGELPSFKPGQFSNLMFGDLPGRDYSMAGAPNNPIWEFHIRRMQDGWVSRHAADTLKVEDRVRIKGPMGDAHLRANHRGAILAIAGGSGLAPIKSIVEAVLQEDPERNVHLYFGVREERDLYMHDHFATLENQHPNLRFIPVLSQVNGETDRRTGFVHDAVRHDFSELDGWKVYMAGPPIMVEAAYSMLKGLGVSSTDIHADAFYSVADDPNRSSIAQPKEQDCV